MPRREIQRRIIEEAVAAGDLKALPIRNW